MAGSYKSGNEPFGSIKGRKLLDQLSDCKQPLLHVVNWLFR